MRSRFEILATPISELNVIRRNPIGDSRGYLERLFCDQALAELLDVKSVKQINHTVNIRAGTIRGMHYQPPPDAEIKFVTCLRGEVFDVAVDLRRNSPTFLHWHGEILSADNHKTLVIPEGFAHGFQTLSDRCEMLYFHTAAYQSTNEGALNAFDARLGISWPMEITEMSDRDRGHPMLTPEFNGIVP